MNTNSLKKFAAEARNILIQGVKQRLVALGFAADGKATEEPQQHEGGATFMGNVVSNDFYTQWMSLHRAIGQRGIKEVAEEAAYTWFNRLVAIRILVKNGLIAPVLAYESEDVHIPVLVSEARQGRLPQMDEQSLRQWEELMNDDSKTDRQFALLIVAFCHATPILHQCFGRITDYTELLLPTNILSEGGLVDLLNHTPFISEEDYHSPELIGWLYQFYISEKKDEVFAKKGKFEADEIPAATQIFTPNWIVKYMVQNTVGRIYLDNNPYSELKETMAYLVEPEEPAPEASIFRFDDIHELTCADLACGSGHILNECFDLLYQCYMEEGYSRRQAVEDIFRYNLTGIDLDTRAKQLATFSLLLKACQKDSSFVDAHCLPRVMDMPVVDRYTFKDLDGHFCCAYGLQEPENHAYKELEETFALMEQADSLGSIMKFEISEDTRAFIRQCIDAYEAGPKYANNFRPLMDGYRMILTLSEKYAALVMNPPYMGSGNMNATLSKYVKDNYADGKADLATVFVQMMGEKIVNQGFYAFIIPPSWMFLSTFEGLRKRIIENKSIRSLLHLSRGVFGADFGASSAVIQNDADSLAKGTYFRLVERTFQEFEQSHLCMLFEQTLANHDFKYRFKDYTKDVTGLPYSEDGLKIYYPNISQKDFEKIPGCPIGYWVSPKIQEVFTSNLALSAVCSPTQGLATADNARFLRLWFEVSRNRNGFDCENAAVAARSGKKWFPHNKGGAFRKWYGNQDCIVNWEHDGYEIKNFKDKHGKLLSRPQNLSIYFKSAISWSVICSGTLNFRYYPQGFIPNMCGMCCVLKSYQEELILLSFSNSKVVSLLIDIINPTMNLSNGVFAKIPSPFNLPIDTNIILKTQQNISISRADWDSHETSWDFQTNELLTMEGDSLEERMSQYKQKWEHLFMQLHDNEEELNRQFIDIYGLQDELTPDVPLEEVTILQQGEISIES